MNKKPTQQSKNWAEIERTIDDQLEKQKDKIKSECGTIGTLAALAVLIFYLKYLITWQFWSYAIVGSFLGALTGIIVFYVFYPIVNKRRIFGLNPIAINLAWLFGWAIQAVFVFKAGDKVMSWLISF